MTVDVAETDVKVQTSPDVKGSSPAALSSHIDSLMTSPQLNAALSRYNDPKNKDAVTGERNPVSTVIKPLEEMMPQLGKPVAPPEETPFVPEDVDMRIKRYRMEGRDLGFAMPVSEFVKLMRDEKDPEKVKSMITGYAEAAPIKWSANADTQKMKAEDVDTFYASLSNVPQFKRPGVSQETAQHLREAADPERLFSQSDIYLQAKNMAELMVTSLIQAK